MAIHLLHDGDETSVLGFSDATQFWTAKEFPFQATVNRRTRHTGSDEYHWTLQFMGGGYVAGSYSPTLETAAKECRAARIDALFKLKKQLAEVPDLPEVPDP